MKKIIGGLLVLTMAFGLAGCKDPITWYKQKDAKQKIADAIQAAVDTKIATTDLEMNIKMTENGNELGTGKFTASEYTDMTNEQDPKFDMTAEIQVHSSEIENNDPQDIKANLHMVADEDDLYILPKLSLSSNEPLSIFTKNSYLKITETDMEMLETLQQQVPSNSAVDEQYALEMKQTLENFAVDFADNIEIEDIDEDKYTVSIKKEKMIDLMDDFFQKIDEVQQNNTGMLDMLPKGESLNKVDTEKIENFDKNELSDMINTDILEADIELDGNEIKNFTTTLPLINIEVDQEALIDLSFGIYNYNKSKPIKTPKSNKIIELQELIDLASTNPTNVINQDFLTEIDLTADEVKEMMSFVSMFTNPEDNPYMQMMEMMNDPSFDPNQMTQEEIEEMMAGFEDLDTLIPDNN